MAQHCKNGQAAAEYLAAHAKVAWVNYPGLPGNKYHALAKKYMPDGTCGVVSFGVKGGREAASRFMAGLELASIATHVADAKHLRSPSRLHHSPADERRGAGRRRGLPRPGAPQRGH